MLIDIQGTLNVVARPHAVMAAAAANGSGPVQRGMRRLNFDWRGKCGRDQRETPMRTPNILASEFFPQPTKTSIENNTPIACACANFELEELCIAFACSAQSWPVWSPGSGIERRLDSQLAFRIEFPTSSSMIWRRRDAALPLGRNNHTTGFGFVADSRRKQKQKHSLPQPTRQQKDK